MILDYLLQHYEYLFITERSLVIQEKQSSQKLFICNDWLLLGKKKS